MAELLDFKNESDFYSVSFEDVELTGQEIASKTFENCVFSKCDFSEAVLKRSKFTDCEFVGCNLSNVKIEYSRFSDVTFRESKMIGINWTTVDWPGLMFASPIKFIKSIISESSFYGLSLQELILDECKAHNVDFREGDFSQANFSYTDFAGSYFGSTNLSGADFSEATDYQIDIYQNQIKHAKFSRFEALSLLDSLEIELVD